MSGELLWWLNLLIGVGVFTLLAVSLNLINGYAGMFHLGHHGFWAMGAYAAAWLTIVLLPSGRFLGEHDRDHDAGPVPGGIGGPVPNLHRLGEGYRVLAGGRKRHPD